MIRAHGVDEIAGVARTRLPPIAREFLQTDGGETSSRQTIPGVTRRVRREVEPSRLMQPKRFNCQNTEDGARAHGATRTMVGQVPPTREVDA